MTVENLAIVSGAAAPAAVAAPQRVTRRCRTSSSSRTRLASRRRRSRARSSSPASACWSRVRRNVLVGRTGVDAGSGERPRPLRGRPARRGQRRRRARPRRSTSAAARPTSTPAASSATRCSRRTTAASSRPARSRPAARSTSSATRSPRAATGSSSAPTRRSTRTRSTSSGDRGPGTDGIVVAAGGFAVAPGHVRITGNRVHDRTGTGIALRTPVRTFMVKENIVARRRRGDRDRGQGRRRARRRRQQRGLRRRRRARAPLAPVGILLMRATSAGVAGNTVARVGLGAPSARVRAGIPVLAVDDVHVSGNVVEEIGPPRAASSGSRPASSSAARSTPSRSRQLVALQHRPQPPAEGEWFALLVQSAGASNVAHLGGGKAVVPRERRRRRAHERLGVPRGRAGDHAGVGSNTLPAAARCRRASCA